MSFINCGVGFGVGVVVKGDELGTLEGRPVGNEEGDVEGYGVGQFVGFVGGFVGLLVGNSVGLRVGCNVRKLHRLRDQRQCFCWLHNVRFFIKVQSFCVGRFGGCKCRRTT